MKKTLVERRGSKYQNQIFLLVFLVAAIPLIIAGGISYSIYMEEITKQSDLSMEATEIQVFNDVENILTGIREYYLEVSVGEELDWLKSSPSIPYSQFSYLEEAQEVLRGPSYLWHYIKNYAFVNLERGWILTNNGMFRLSDVRNQEQMNRFLGQAMEDSSMQYWKNSTEEAPYSRGLFESNYLDVSGLQMIYKFRGSGSNMAQVLFVQLNQEYLEERLAENAAVHDICILNRDGELFYSSDEALSAFCARELEALGSLVGMAEYDLSEFGAGVYRLRSTGFSPNGMMYVTAYDLSQMQETGSRLLVNSFVIAGVLALLLLVCRLITYYLYQPVKSIASYVSSAAGDQEEKQLPEKDEFTVIRQNVGYLVDAKESLQQTLKRQQRLLLEQFLLRTVRGELTPEEIGRGEEQFGLKTAKAYQMLTFLCMVEQEEGQESDLEQDVLGISVVENMPAEILEALVTVPFCYGDQIMLLIGGENESELSGKTGELYLALSQYVSEQFGLSIIAGASQVFPRLKYMRTAYNECTETLRNTGKTSHSNITYYGEISRDDGIISGYDFVLENSLVKAVDSGDTETAKQLIDKFINSLNNRGINRHDRSFYLYRLIISVLSVLSDAGLNANQVFGEEQFSDDIFKQLTHIYDSQKLKEYLAQQIILPAIDALKQYRYDSSSDILRRIVELVRETKGDITLAECAEQLNYHPSYIWKVLKAERNMTFTDLVNEEKLENAKQMLLNTDYTVAEIAERLNYSNTQNFIRFFSKYVQTSPGKYRKEHQSVHNI